MSALPEGGRFVADVCRSARLGHDACLKLTLLVEELFANTVEHGHGGDSDAAVHIAFEVASDRTTLTYEDEAPPYDPFVAVAPPDDRASVEERLVGGLGLQLVAAMASEIRYRRHEGRNRISLVVPAPR